MGIIVQNLFPGLWFGEIGEKVGVYSGEINYKRPFDVLFLFAKGKKD